VPPTGFRFVKFLKNLKFQVTKLCGMERFFHLPKQTPNPPDLNPVLPLVSFFLLRCHRSVGLNFDLLALSLLLLPLLYFERLNFFLT
jgi:hypothetical protein